MYLLSHMFEFTKFWIILSPIHKTSGSASFASATNLKCLMNKKQQINLFGLFLATVFRNRNNILWHRTYISWLKKRIYLRKIDTTCLQVHADKNAYLQSHTHLYANLCNLDNFFATDIHWSWCYTKIKVHTVHFALLHLTSYDTFLLNSTFNFYKFFSQILQ